MTIAVCAFLFGLLIGSFLNVCIFRMPRDLSVVRPRSYCPECKTPVAWHDNLPLVSFALLRGRCRHCAARISWRYPVVELLTGALFFLVVLALGPGLAALKVCVFCALTIGLLFSDLEQRILPDEFTLGGAVLGVLLAAVVPMEWGYSGFLIGSRLGARWLSVVESLLGALSVSGLLWMVGSLFEKIRHKEGLGFGDVKMIAMVGSFLGLAGAFQTIILGSIVGTVIGLVFIKLKRHDSSTYELPFGTFLGAAALFVALAQSRVLEFYFR